MEFGCCPMPCSGGWRVSLWIKTGAISDIASTATALAPEFVPVLPVVGAGDGLTAAAAMIQVPTLRRSVGYAVVVDSIPS